MTGPLQVEEVALLVQPVGAVVVAVFQEAQTESLLLSLPRFSPSCSAARGAAAAKPKREERMVVERMAMRKCEGLSGKKRVRDSEAVDCVIGKIEKERELVSPSYRIHVPCSMVDTHDLLPVPRGATLLAKSRRSRVHVLEKVKES